MLMGPISALFMNVAEVVSDAVSKGCSIRASVVVDSVGTPLYFSCREERPSCFARIFLPGCEGAGVSLFEWGRARRLLLGAGGVPEASEVLLGFLGSALSIGSEGAMVSCGVVALSIGVPQMVPIGSEGVPVVWSGVVDSESVGISWGISNVRK